MRVQMRLSRPAVAAMMEYKRIKFADPHARVTNGYLVGMAYKTVQENLNRIDWMAVNMTEPPGVTGNYDESITDTQTALNLEITVLEGIEKLQKEFMNIFGTKRMFKPFVIKLLLFAAILKETNRLTFLKEEEQHAGE